MSNAITSQHPAVVLRSHYQHLRILLVVAMIAVVGLAVAVVVLATNDHNAGTSAQASSNAGASDESGARLDHRGIVAPAPYILPAGFKSDAQTVGADRHNPTTSLTGAAVPSGPAAAARQERQAIAGPRPAVTCGKGHYCIGRNASLNSSRP